MGWGREGNNGCGASEGDVFQLVGRGIFVDIARRGHNHLDMADVGTVTRQPKYTGAYIHAVLP